MKTLKQLLFIIVLFSLTGCASILNPRYQNVEISAPKGSTVYIDGEKAEKKGKTYKLDRKTGMTQIQFKKEGFKDEFIVVDNYKKSFLYALSWIPFNIIYLLPANSDHGDKSFNFDKKINGPRNLKSLPEKGEEFKEIRIDQISVSLGENDGEEITFWNYAAYIREQEGFRKNGIKDEVDIEYSSFEILLNEMLVDKGYIDTSDLVFKESYSNNLNLKADIVDFTATVVRPSMISVFFEIDWEVQDLYGSKLYAKTIKEEGNSFCISEENDKSDFQAIIQRAVKDALEVSMLEFLGRKEVLKYLKAEKGKKKEVTKEEKELRLSSTARPISELSETIEGSVTIKNKDGHGSGFFISDKGHLMTNYHVIAGVKKEDMTVVDNAGNEHKVTSIAAVSKGSDLAVLKIDAKSPNYLKLNTSEKITVTEEVYAIGTPSAADLNASVTKGIISGKRKTEEGGTLIQLDASINAGNSGGPLVNKNGEVIGIVTAKVAGIGIEGIGFAVPAYQAINVLNLKF